MIRVNLKNGTCDHIPGKPTDRWYIHETDDSVDVAVMPTKFPGHILDHLTIPTSMFEEQEKQQIIQGDEVFITGLFTNFYGKQRNIPIVRTGNMAMIPDERVHLEEFGNAEVYLIEARSRGGLSGSPVFFKRPIVMPNMPRISSTGKLERPPTLTTKDLEQFQENPFRLLGLIHGHYSLIEDKTLIDSNVEKIMDEINTGIALVVPANKILEVINHPELTELRKQAERNI